MSEALMWDALRPLLAGLDPVRIESPMTEGNPDVNYLHGWIELKFARCWPARPSTPLRLPHYTKEQRGWATRRAHAGGAAFLLLQVGGHGNKMGEEWLLFHGVRAYQRIGHLDRQSLYLLALARWTRRPKREELQPHLCSVKTLPPLSESEPCAPEAPRASIAPKSSRRARSA